MKVLATLVLLSLISACSSGSNPFYVPGRTCQKDMEVLADLTSKDSLDKSKLKKSTLDVSSLPAGEYIYNGASIYYESTHKGKRSLIQANHALETEQEKVAKKLNAVAEEDNRIKAECSYNPNFSKGFIYSIEGVSTISIKNDKTSTINTKKYSLTLGTPGESIKPTDVFRLILTDVNETNIPGAPKDSYGKNAKVFMYKSTDPSKVNHYELRALEDRGEYSMLVITRFIKK